MPQLKGLDNLQQDHSAAWRGVLWMPTAQQHFACTWSESDNVQQVHCTLGWASTSWIAFWTNTADGAQHTMRQRSQPHMNRIRLHAHSLNAAMVTCIMLSSYITLWSRHHPLPCRLITDATDHVTTMSTSSNSFCLNSSFRPTEPMRTLSASTGNIQCEFSSLFHQQLICLN